MAGRGNRVTIDGMDKLREALERLAPDIIAAAKKTVKESAEAVREDTKRAVRVDTTNTRESVDIDYQEDGLRAEVGWKDREDWYVSLHEHGTRRIPANPALGPALEAERAKFEDRLKAEVRKVLP
ncbi:HK97-gp10 family putative phage morphogenesis protein [Streptomyces sp. NPDC002994]|uniref:HK97-gp10 family putative phage morphogenesis protein n=1 Tax=Streptomyces sp. NPDC002994 TaxID=3154441 RepID=UPI0033A4ECEF